MTYVRLDPTSIPRGEILTSPVERPDPPLPNSNVGAILPIPEDRQPISDDLYNALLPDENTPDSALIERLRLSDEMLAAMVYLARQADTNGRLDALTRVFAAGMPGTAISYSGIKYSPADCIGGVRDPAPGMRLGRIVGFHLDNRDKLPIETRINSRRRVVTNVGPGDRWGLFCVPDALEAADRLGYGPQRIPGSKLYGEFVDKYPDEVQSVWFPVPPGYAYVLPTDWVDHDAATLGAVEPSTSVSIVGHWKRGELAECIGQ